MRRKQLGPEPRRRESVGGDLDRFSGCRRGRRGPARKVKVKKKSYKLKPESKSVNSGQSTNLKLKKRDWPATGTHAAGVPMRTLQEWMGHKDFATMLIYADYSPDDRRERDLLSARRELDRIAASDRLAPMARAGGEFAIVESTVIGSRWGKPTAGDRWTTAPPRS